MLPLHPNFIVVAVNVLVVVVVSAGFFAFAFAFASQIHRLRLFIDMILSGWLVNDVDIPYSLSSSHQGRVGFFRSASYPPLDILSAILFAVESLWFIGSWHCQ